MYKADDSYGLRGGNVTCPNPAMYEKVPFTKLPYSELAGSFVDKFGVQWGFMTE